MAVHTLGLICTCCGYVSLDYCLPCMARCPCMVVRVVYPPIVSCVRFTLTCEIDTLADSHVHLVKVLKKHELCSVVISTCVGCQGCRSGWECWSFYSEKMTGVQLHCFGKAVLCFLHPLSWGMLLKLRTVAAWCACAHTHIVCVRLSVCVRVCMLGQCVQRHTVLKA